MPHYIVYSRYSQTLRYFKLVGGRYQEQPLAPQIPLIWLPDLHLGLGNVISCVTPSPRHPVTPESP